MQTLMQQLTSGDLQPLSGTHLDFHLPLSEKLLNDLARAQLTGPVHDMRIELLERNEMILYLDLEIKIPVLGTQSFKRRLHLKLDESFDPQTGNNLRITIVEGLKAEKILMQWFDGLINKSFPDGISLVDNDFIIVDPRRLLAGQGFEKFAPYVRKTTLHTKNKVLYINSAIDVPGQA